MTWQKYLTVNHDILLFKLNYYAIDGEILDWFTSYLYSREQRVEIKSSETYNFCYSWKTVKHGVPHDLLLGPLPCYIHINDFPTQINSLTVVIMFADDTSILISHTNYDDL